MRLSAKLQWINKQVHSIFTDDTFAASICFEFDFRSHSLQRCDCRRLWVLALSRLAAGY